MKPSISVVILTYNESLHIRRCIESVKDVCQDIYLVDSFSTDDTVQVAQSLGAIVYQNKWENNYAKQFNWGLDNLPITTDWVLRLDADEYLTPELASEIVNKLPNLSNEVNGVELPLRRIFQGREITKGTGGINLLRIFRYGKAWSETRWMDEHIKLSSGKTVVFEHAFADHNLNNLGWWTAKHNGYAIREAIDLLDIEFNLLGNHAEEVNISDQAAYKRRRKHKYAKQPLFWRSFAYFLYRYILKGGFTEGKEGFMWHFLQGWWYRTLVDVKIYEIKKNCGTDVAKIKAFIEREYSISL
ncbi:spsA [Pontibacter korlensis]|uniref:SpsA n=1 Tax=Pontibacter korlensis TaxID=400092 RepID=A0A0E3UVL3_9BACT|nr:glycosyltransferase family 2 protein [Pontibacter korlensis]AKD01931.1 spsA [Pontibacter korlensis]